MASSPQIIQLREVLARRFPHLRCSLPETSVIKTPALRPTGLAQLDHLLHGGLPQSGITELLSTRSGSGSGLLLLHCLRQACQQHQWTALVDGQDCFDPAALHNEFLSSLLWIRCRDAAQALKATDILLRDGNLPVVLLDLSLNPLAQLRKIPATTWYRLQRILEPTSTALLVITPRILVSSAKIRVTLTSRFTLEALAETEEELAPQLKFDLAQDRLRSAEPPVESCMAEAG